MQNKIALIAMAVFSILVLLGFDIQLAYAQTSNATITLFETGNASDDTCTSITQTGSIVWLGCFASASNTLRINAMSGNTTIATTTLASQSTGGDLVFFPSGSDSIVFVDTAGASEVVRKYTLSGSTITNTASLTLTNCQAGANRPQLVGSLIFYLCDAGTEAGNIKVINPNTMILEDTYTTLHQGNCTNAQSIQMNTGVKGVVFCDNTEANLFTISGSTITFSDELTGWTSLTTGRAVIFTGQSGNSFTVWTFQYTAGSTIEVATVDIDSVTWTSGITTVPSQSDVVGGLPIALSVFPYIFTIDATDDNILAYDWKLAQPSVAKANFSGSGLDITNSAGFSIGSDNITLLIASSVADKGRYYIVSSIVVDGNALTEGGTGDDPSNEFCSLPENRNILICRLLLDTPQDEPTIVLPRVGLLITTNLTDMLCSILPFDCDANPDVRTNGVGYLFTIVLFAIMMSIFWVATNGQLNKIPTFIWMISSLALLGSLVAMAFLDATFLVIGVIIIVALAAMQIRNSITSGLDFASGDF